jgi:hypothetical protein
MCPIDGEPLGAPLDPFIGTIIAGRYVVEELLGLGGMARSTARATSSSAATWRSSSWILR